MPDARAASAAQDSIEGPLVAPRCQAITTLAELSALEDTWRELFSDVENPTPFRSWDFAIEWFRHFVLGEAGGATGRFEVAVAFDHRGRVIGLAPFYEERSVGAAALGLTLQPFGRSLTFESMTDEWAALLRRGSELLAENLLKAHLARRAVEGGYDIAVLAGSNREALGKRRSYSWSDGAGCAEIARVISGPMVLRLPGSWERFRQGLSKSMRDNVGNYPRKLSRMTDRWVVHSARSPDDVASATARLVDLHRGRSRSTIGTPHTNHIATATQAAFLDRWFRRLAARNEISILLLEADGAVIAAQAFLETSQRTSVYYSGYDEHWYRCSPLTVITTHAIRDAISRRLRQIDFPPGVTPWKSRWGAEEKSGLQETSIYSMRLPALFRGLARRLHLRLAQ